MRRSKKTWIVKSFEEHTDSFHYGQLLICPCAPFTLEPVINFIPLKSKKCPSVPWSQTMGVWETEGRAGIRAM
jgi:hypothetical protein